MEKVIFKRAALRLPWSRHWSHRHGVRRSKT